MNIVTLSNFFNHHQQPIAFELDRLTNGGFRFIELMPMPNSFREAGYPDYSSSPLVLSAWKSDHNANIAKQLLLESDVVLFGNINDYTIIKARLLRNKLTFEVGERWLKKGLINLLSPRLIKSQWYYHTSFYNKPLYRLNASAYATNDMAFMKSFKNRCFKWGYFTEVPEIEIDDLLRIRRQSSKIRILFVARLIQWKHPEYAVLLAERLRNAGFNFELFMYGSGDLQHSIDKMVIERHLEQFVLLKGNVSNAEITEQMRKSHMFIFTSDKNEGWGAVVNEAMGNGCPVVGSDEIGSIPFLIDNGVNGLIFKSGNIDDLVQRVEQLIQSEELRERMSRNAYNTMKELWSPRNAAVRLLTLIDNLKHGETPQFINGPCSIATPIQIHK